jgi:very-short-patch-repair endonuclease
MREPWWMKQERRAKRVRDGGPEETAAERRFAKRLREAGITFEREVVLSNTATADFVICEHLAVVEVDGPYHEDPSRQAKDRERDAWCRAHDLTVFRVKNEEVDDWPLTRLTSLRKWPISMWREIHMLTQRERRIPLADPQYGSTPDDEHCEVDVDELPSEAAGPDEREWWSDSEEG